VGSLPDKLARTNTRSSRFIDRRSARLEPAHELRVLDTLNLQPCGRLSAAILKVRRREPRQVLAGQDSRPGMALVQQPPQLADTLRQCLVAAAHILEAPECHVTSQERDVRCVLHALEGTLLGNHVTDQHLQCSDRAAKEAFISCGDGGHQMARSGPVRGAVWGGGNGCCEYGTVCWRRPQLDLKRCQASNCNSEELTVLELGMFAQRAAVAFVQKSPCRLPLVSQTRGVDVRV
jgi:hypothetical protein